MLNAHNRERIEPVKYIIIHAFSTPYEEMIANLDRDGLSVHYIITERGIIIQNCPEDKVAYHAGQSSWLGQYGSLNECSIGIELEATNLGQQHSDYSKATFTNLNALLEVLIRRYRIRRENVLGHSDIAPSRKADPGAGIPWRYMYRKGFAVWYNRNTISKETNEGVLLTQIGYNTSDIDAARCAFCRHFYPEAVPVDEDIQHLLDNPYPKGFRPDDWDEYMTILRHTAKAFEDARAEHFWYEDVPLRRNI